MFLIETFLPRSGHQPHVSMLACFLSDSINKGLKDSATHTVMAIMGQHHKILDEESYSSIGNDTADTSRFTLYLGND